MVEYKSKPNTHISANGKLVSFNSLGSAFVNKPEVMKVLDSLNYVTKVEYKEEGKQKKVKEGNKEESKQK